MILVAGRQLSVVGEKRKNIKAYFTGMKWIKEFNAKANVELRMKSQVSTANIRQLIFNYQV